MLDVDTFLTALYVMVDDFYNSRPREQRRPGPDASLSPSEVITLAIFARWSRFASERDFYRYAKGHLREKRSPPCPTVPSSTAVCASTRSSSRRWPCIWRRRWRLRNVLTKPWTARHNAHPRRETEG
jgi:hypothetical protein